MCEHGLTDTLPWRPCNSISSLNLVIRGGPQTPQRRSRDPWEHTKTYEPFKVSGVPGSHSPSFTRTSSTNVSTSKCVNLLQFYPQLYFSIKFWRGSRVYVKEFQWNSYMTCIGSCRGKLIHHHWMSRFHRALHILLSGSRWGKRWKRLKRVNPNQNYTFNYGKRERNKLAMTCYFKQHRMCS